MRKKTFTKLILNMNLRIFFWFQMGALLQFILHKM